MSKQRKAVLFIASSLDGYIAQRRNLLNGSIMAKVKLIMSFRNFMTR